MKALEITDWGSREPDHTTEHGSDLRRNRRRETKLNAEESPVYVESLSQCPEKETARFKGDIRRKSEVHPLPKTTLPLFSQPRRKSTSEVGRHRCSGNSNLKLTLAVAWRNDEHMCNETSSPLNTTKRVICDNERVEETPKFRTMSRENINEKLSFAGPTLHRAESNGDRMRSEHRRINTHTEHMQDKGLLSRPFSTQKLRLPTPEESESTRSRSLSGSDLEDYFMSAEQREKLDRLKRQIYDANSKRKNCRKVSESRSDVFSGCKHQQNSGHNVVDGSTLPVLTEKSLKRHSKSHERLIWATPGSQSLITVAQTIYTDTSARSNVSDAVSNPNSYVDLAGHMGETDFDKSATSLNTESSELPLMPSTLTHSADNEQVKRESNRFHFPPPTSEGDDFSESITVIIDRLRARSEPGDVGSRKASTAKQYQSRTRSETDALKEKVQSFVAKPLPALPPTTLRVKKSLDGVPAKSGHFKSGANANIAPQLNERKEGVINIHTCPTLNLFPDQSWMYQDKSQRKHRYIRGPATPVPPLDSVFRKTNSDTS